MEFLRLLGEYKGEIDGWLEKFFEEKLIKVEKVDEEVLGVVKGLKEIGMKGKRLRGFLVGVGYGVGNGWQRLEWRRVPDEVWKVGMGLELFHLGLLVQDDVMDRDEVRRGVKTIHARYDDLHYGEAMADLGADMCFGWAAELLAEGGSLAVVGEWGRYFERVARGQVLDLKIKKEKRKKKKEGYVVGKELEPDGWVEPRIVVEVAADEITRSPVHSSGYALRFPRLVRFRDDKRAEEATSLREVKEMVPEAEQARFRAGQS